MWNGRFCNPWSEEHVDYVREFENARFVLFKQASTTCDQEICVGRVRRKKLRSTSEVTTAVTVVLN